MDEDEIQAEETQPDGIQTEDAENTKEEQDAEKHCCSLLDGFYEVRLLLAVVDNPGGAQTYQPAREFQPAQSLVPVKLKQPLKRGDSMALQGIIRNSRRGNQSFELRAIGNSSVLVC
ncbi:hypothetical protein FPHYL_3372 [Fusarium phyllophilum]|uniref:Uncharacterized protein n=1 Tax=Fusarium phyllophilum TaxID=47803 RepID=A0A8H5K5V3_9HYPO|nr:hypothetical protein FPHYL_3372 [Fusarium phyllophilum]